jgi:arginine decarboxylase
MLERTTRRQRHKVLIVDDKLADPTGFGGRGVRELVDEFAERGVSVVEATSFADGEAAVVSDAALDAVLIDWTRAGEDEGGHPRALKLLRLIRSRNAEMPVVLMADRADGDAFTVEVMSLANEFVWMLEDTAAFIAGRVLAAIKRYLQDLLPPFTAALFEYMDVSEYSWAAPGHQGGVAFTKTPEGRIFYDFFGENLFRSDTGIERSALGSLLDHTGPIGEAEAYAARIFGAHRSYSVLTGTSGANRAVMAAAVPDGAFAICDRNCHKSVEQGLVLSGGIPLFLVPTRNRYGIIGPIPPQAFEPQTIRARLAAHPLAGDAAGPDAAYAVITNCTYDGLCYDAEAVERRLAESTDRIHFDEAWYAYARFNPLYEGRHAMRGDPDEHDGERPTVFSTQSTHKLLAALSQASYIHVRDGRRAIPHSIFNEAYMAQQSTSPLYALIASNEIGAAMMEGPSGLALTREVIDEAIRFRQSLARAHASFAARRDWFFRPWNAPTILDAETGETVPFAEVSAERLATDPSCWTLRPGETWHGFDGLPDGWCLLDPTKAGIVCPGMGEDGHLEETGIPAPVLTAYLHRHGIIPSRTTDFMVLCLFSIGVTRGKWGTLINTLLNFKRDWDADMPLKHVLPELVALAPRRYGGLGLKGLSDEMFAHMRSERMDEWQARAFASLPVPLMSPRRANAELLAGRAEQLPLDRAAGRVAGVGVIPYPPGIPIVLPGETLGAADGPWLGYMRVLEAFGRAFPGFEKELEGAVLAEDGYRIWCLAD